jgi:serine/threonine-protein kinase
VRGIVHRDLKPANIKLRPDGQAANGTGTAERVVEGTGPVIVAYTMSPDGRHLVFRGARQGSSDLMIVDLGDGRRAQSLSSGVGEQRPLVQTSFEEINAEISPDGRWLAYQSNSSGTFEVYVRPFPDVASGQWLVSTTGGAEPLWARDSRELFYRAPNGGVMRVSIASGSTWSAGAPVQLIDGRSYLVGATGSSTVSRTYDVSGDGKRFLMIKRGEAPPQTSTAERIVVVQHWFEELKARVPMK